MSRKLAIKTSDALKLTPRAQPITASKRNVLFCADYRLAKICSSQKVYAIKNIAILFSVEMSLILLQYFCETDVLRTQNKTLRLLTKRWGYQFLK